MFKVKIYGAGSIGNHLAHACRNKDWDVTICDLDPDALNRTKNDIYPARYGKWDESIKLYTLDKLPKDNFDLIIIGTPPDTHENIAFKILETETPKVLLVEKPFCTPDLSRCQELLDLAEKKGVFIGVAYNHVLTDNTKLATKLLSNDIIGNPLAITVNWMEYWGGIFKAHPWLNGPQDTYLGFYERGGGACGEHSHSINIWQYFADVLGLGKITEVTAVMDIVENDKVKYDRFSNISVKTEKGFIGNIIEDVITEPSEKSLRIQGDKGFLEWYVNYENGKDAVIYWDGQNEIKKELINKTRPDDFKNEIDHIGEILKGNFKGDSPISLKKGLETMLIIAASHKSNQLGKRVKIDYIKGFCNGAVL